MKITDKIPPIKIDAYIHQAQEQGKTKSIKSKGGPNPAVKEDRVEFSQTVKDLSRAREQLRSIPDIQEEKVAEIKNQIETGTYKIDGKKIAINMIKESLIDEMA